MAQTWGAQRPIVPSALGQQFSIGESVWILYKKKHEKVTIETLLVNSAVVKLDRTNGSLYDQLKNKTVVSYTKLQKISE